MNKLLVFLSIIFYLFTQSVNAKKLAELERLYNLDKGFIGVIYDKEKDKTYLRIDNLGQEFIYLTGLSGGLGSNDIGLDRGQLTDSRLVVFERVSNNRVLLKQKPTKFRTSSANKKAQQSFQESFAPSILWGFSVVDSGKGWVLVDASDFILQDVHGAAKKLADLKQGKDYKVDPSRSVIYMPRTTAFPDNTELEAKITLVGEPTGEHLKQVAADPLSIGLRMHHSFVRLPAAGYKSRMFLPKSGYLSLNFQDYAQPTNQDLTQRFILRHRLKKKNPSAEISAPVKPIIYYLESGVPEPIKSAILEGAAWWDQAFQAIGYKNAFQVKMLPAHVDPMDVRYNVIQWIDRATRGWSYGTTVIDPRSGEIIKGHVTLGSLRARQDYLIAQGLLAPFTTQNEKDETLLDLVLARIRQLSAHELGHTLGLAHNFAASNYGRQSVMDYPHPQFQLQGNQVIAPNAYTAGLGNWDKAAIAYGYNQFSKEKEEASLHQLIVNNAQKRLLYIGDEDARDPGSPHAYASLWDNGGDAVSEFENMLKIREVALKNFGAKNIKRNRAWSDLQEILVPVYYFHRYQIAAVSKWIGGLDYDYSIKRSSVPVEQKTLSGEKQKRAITSMLTSLQPDFLALPPETLKILLPKAAGHKQTNESVKGATGVAFDSIALAEASAQHTLGLIFHPHRIARLIQQNAVDSNIPSLDELTTEIHRSIIEQSYEGINGIIHQSVVALIYSNYLNLLYDERSSQQVKMQILAILLKEKEYLQRKLVAVRKNSGYYGLFAYQLKRLENISIESISTNDKKLLLVLPKMPPGSPI